MGNGACTQQQPSIDEVNIKRKQEIDHPLPLLNSQSQSPSKPSLESKHPTIPKFDEEEFEIHFTNEDQNEELSPIRESRLSKAQSPTKIIKSKHTFKQEEIYFLDLLKQDKTKVRRKSADRQLSPVKVVHQRKHHNTAMVMEETQHNSSQLIKVKRLSYQLDEAVIMPSEPKSILKTIGSEKSITNSQRSKTNSKKVRFGKVYRQTNI